MKFLERPGTFKACPTEWSVQALPSGSPIVRVNFECSHVLEGDEWQPMREPARVRGDFFVLKQTGEPNPGVVDSLCRVLGWDGTFEQVHRSPFPPNMGVVQVEVEAREYKGKTYCQVKYLDAEGSKPRNAPISAIEAANLDKKYGGSLSRIAKKSAAAAKRDVPPPADDDIPF